LNTGTDILIYVEDPGAANYVAPLEYCFSRNEISAKFLASGKALIQLKDRGISVEEINSISANEILEKYRPKVVLLGTSENQDSLSFSLIEKARGSAIKTVAVVDAPSNAAYRFRGRTSDPTAYMPDWLLVPDSKTRSAYEALGFPRVVVCGHPHYDHIKEVGSELDQIGRKAIRFRVFPDAGEKKVVLFAAEISRGLNNEQYNRTPDYTLEGSGLHESRTSIVLEEFFAALKSIKPEPFTVLRLHPKNSLDEFTPFLPSFNMVSHGGTPLELVYAADLVTGMTSMLLLEASLLGTRTLAIVPRRSELEWLPSIGWGLTKAATTSLEIATLMKSELQSDVDLKPGNEVIPENSIQRVIRLIEDLLGTEEAGE
jgi:hypothetical protein